MLKKIGHVTFDHHPEFKGEVKIIKGETEITVSIDALRAFIAESVRFDLANHIQKMKPADLLRRIA